MATMSGDRLTKKLRRKLHVKEYDRERERRYLRKRSEEDDVLEEVFDKTTLMTLYKLINTGAVRSLHGVVSAGKESRVYEAETSEGTTIAVKIYLISSAEFRRNREAYLTLDPRFKRVPSKFRSFVYLWAKREYSNLAKAFESGVACPQPLFVEKNILGMTFIGRDEMRFPTLVEIDLLPTEYQRIYKEILENVRRLYVEAGLVHGDLSIYNVFVTDDVHPILMDFSQAVVLDHPNASTLLERDIGNLVTYFKKRGVRTGSLEATLGWVKGKSE